MRRLRRGLPLLAGCVALTALAVAAHGRAAAPREARVDDAAGTDDPDLALDALFDHLRRAPDDAEANRRLGELLLAREDVDRAAHHLEHAYALFTAAGDEKSAKLAERDLNRADTLNRRRRKLYRDLTKTLLLSAEQLAEKENYERALDKLDGVAPIAEGDDAAELIALYESLTKRFEELDIEAGLDGAEAGGARPLVTHESEHYVIEANLEPELTRRVGDLMDSVHGHYVDVYFAGDEGAAKSRKATIRIHSDWDAMAEEWTGPRAPQGWWSPGQNRVVCYDTRTNGENATLDWMLETLFHEASHQFMTLRSRKGGWSPAWLNEGTASFFEGTVAMADNTVLWPDAARLRLQNLARMIVSRSGPGVEKVISHAGPGSYPPDHYAWGWGLVYFFQQFEDPETLEYVYRPLYDECLEEITSKGGDSREMFEAFFIGERSPLGHETLEDFTAAWEAWILDQVQPLYFGSGDSIRELRVARAHRYLAAADVAAETSRAKVSEEELLRRALADLEYVRTRIDTIDEPDGDIWLTQIDVLERLERPKSAAPMLQEFLDLADQGLVALPDERREDLERRLRKLDRGNWALLNAKSRERRLLRSAHNLLADYEDEDPPYVLRAYTFAQSVGAALGDEEVLLPRAAELRERARAAGLLLGRIRPMNRPGDDWDTIYNGDAKRFEHDGDRLLIESVRPMAFYNASFEVGHEYEIRCTLQRDGELYLSSNHGLVIAAHPDGDWAVLDFGAKGGAHLRRIERTGGGAQRRLIESFTFEPRVADDEDPRVVVRVAGRDVTLTVGDREPVRFTLPDEIPPAQHVGFSAKDSTVVLVNAEVEIFP